MTYWWILNLKWDIIRELNFRPEWRLEHFCTFHWSCITYEFVFARKDVRIRQTSLYTENYTNVRNTNQGELILNSMGPILKARKCRVENCPNRKWPMPNEYWFVRYGHFDKYQLFQQWLSSWLNLNLGFKRENIVQE